MFDGGVRNTHNGVMANADPAEGSSTRHRILQVSLSLMSQKGVDGTSMRDLASAAGLNVASLYHYFPSKRELLEAVLVERGYLPEWDAGPKPDDGPAAESALAAVLADILVSMFEVEDFVRLMAGEAMRGEETARAVGVDLFTTFEAGLADWIVTHRPDLADRVGAPAVAHLLTAMVVGIFVQYTAGVGGEHDRNDLKALLTQRANEMARLLGPSID
jgi:AcrR family transcriptional regulator